MAARHLATAGALRTMTGEQAANLVHLLRTHTPTPGEDGNTTHP